jgi:chromosome partitioning protein
VKHAPRRQQFDRGEFDSGPVRTPLYEPRVSRETTAAFPKPASTRIIVIANQKGGVGKTTTAVNVAVGLALGGMDVLVVDMDPQGNASTALGIDHRPGIRGTYEVLIDGDDVAWHVVASPEAPTLKVLPATIDLAGAELELVSKEARERRLETAIDAYLAERPTDYVILDCPPSLGLLTVNALVAAREILIPIQCEYYALEGVSQLARTIEIVSRGLNTRLEISTVLPHHATAARDCRRRSPTKYAATSPPRPWRRSSPARCGCPRPRATGRASLPITPALRGPWPICASPKRSPSEPRRGRHERQATDRPRTWPG